MDGSHEWKEKAMQLLYVEGGHLGVEFKSKFGKVD